MNARVLSTLLVILSITSPLAPTAGAAPLGTAFTYQGRMTDGSNPASGLYDLRFTLFDAASGGAQVGTPSVVTADATPVSNGVFTVSLDFGAAFAGQVRWLAIEVKTNLTASYNLLTPRTELAPVPHALYALRAGSADGVAPGSVTSAGLAPGSVNGATIANGTVGIGDLNSFLLNETFWKLGGNAGTTPGASFLGTTDNQPLELRVNNRAALRILPNLSSPNVIGGHPDNSISAGVTGTFIGGGGAASDSRNHVSTNFGVVAGGYGNSVDGNASVIGGGGLNFIGQNSDAAAIVGGFSNNIGESSAYSSIGGGNANVVSNASPYSIIAGGDHNGIGHHSLAGTIGGGSLNSIGELSRGSTVAGGESNQVGTNSPGGAIGGGRINFIGANVLEATISGGTRNRIGSNSYHSVISGGGNNEISTNSFASVIGGGAFNSVGYASTHSTIAGGGGNAIGSNSFGSAISGGSGNRILTNSQHGTISGGRDNLIGTNSLFSVVGGGYQNTNVGRFATIPGGLLNLASGDYSQATGRRARAIHNGSSVWADDTDADFASTTNKQFAVRANNGVMVQSANTALDLRGGGAVRVAGAGVNSATPVFIHRASTGSVSGNTTVIDHPHCNGNPGAILIVTHNYSADTAPNTYETEPVGVWYNGTRWTIFHENNVVAMPVGRAFNVMVFKP